MKILGLSAFYHDSAAALIMDGDICAAAQEERFTRKRHDPNFPERAINYCLEEAFIQPKELDAVVFYDNPLLNLDRIMKSALFSAPQGEKEAALALRSIFSTKAKVRAYLEKCFGHVPKLLFSDHHQSHAAAAFYPSPFEEAAILTVDGVGEWTTTSIGKGRGEKIELLREIAFPHSLGLLYSAFTYYCGFKVNSGEYKLMGLAPYGRPIYADKIREHLIQTQSDGSYRLNLEYFGYLDSSRMTNDAFHELFEGPPRSPESRLTRREMDLAASIQKVLEDQMLALTRQAHALTGSKNLVLAGGVALNCVANGRILREGPFARLWIQPAAGDAGSALGAALLANHQYFNQPRKVSVKDSQKGSLLGPAYREPEILAFLDRSDIPHTKIDDEKARCETIATELDRGAVVGFFAGRMEFGPRALGARSILGDARKADTQIRMNLKIKYRESFRPFAPIVLKERVSDYFELADDSPYMLLVAPVKKERQLPRDESLWEKGEPDLLEWIRQPRSDVPAITHVDYSARIQTVTSDTHPAIYQVLKAFERQTGCAVLVNTSFNLRGEPIVCTPEDAYRCFMRSDMDLLVLENILIYKKDQKPLMEKENWRDQYELD